MNILIDLGKVKYATVLERLRAILGFFLNFVIM